jgi:hypothetical protein
MQQFLELSLKLFNKLEIFKTMGFKEKYYKNDNCFEYFI